MSSWLNQGWFWGSGLVLILLLSSPGKSCSVNLWHLLPSPHSPTSSTLVIVFLWSGSSEKCWCFLRFLFGVFTACCSWMILSKWFGACVFLPTSCWCSAGSEPLCLLCSCVSAFLFACVSLLVPVCLRALCLSLITACVWAEFWAVVNFLLSARMCVSAVCFTTALRSLGLILCFGPVLLAVKCGSWGPCWGRAGFCMAPAVFSFFCLCLFTDVGLFSCSVFVLRSCSFGVSDTDCFFFAALLFHSLLWIWLSLSATCAAGGRFTRILEYELDLNSPAELRTREERRSISTGGEGKGRVTVITEMVRRRMKNGHRRGRYFLARQSFDHTRQAYTEEKSRIIRWRETEVFAPNRIMGG